MYGSIDGWRNVGDSFNLCRLMKNTGPRGPIVTEVNFQESDGSPSRAPPRTLGRTFQKSI